MRQVPRSEACDWRCACAAEHLRLAKVDRVAQRLVCIHSGAAHNQGRAEICHAKLPALQAGSCACKEGQVRPERAKNGLKSPFMTSFTTQ